MMHRTSAGIGFAAESDQARRSSTGSEIGWPVIGGADPSLTPEELTNIRVYDGANRGVVNILTNVVSYDRFFMLPSPGEGAGSGSVIDKQGHILTNNHVIEDAQAIQVTLPNGKSYTAELVGHGQGPGCRRAENRCAGRASCSRFRSARRIICGSGSGFTRWAIRSDWKAR